MNQGPLFNIHTRMLSGNQTVSWTKKHSLVSKWNMLFDKSPEWISFKPQPKLKVYPCYSCRNMFSSKLTFQDHINRRVIIIKFKCSDCSNTLTFYNRCSFLLHTRKHYSLREGQINLANVDIFLLPVELAGFTYHESIPFLFDEEEEYVASNIYVNSQFYNPDDGEAGKQVVTVKPYNLVFHYAEGEKNMLLTLKQITSNIPLCQFVAQETNAKQISIIPEIISNANEEVSTVPDTVNNADNSDKNTENEVVDESYVVEVKQEMEAAPVEEFTMPIISKIESLSETSTLKKIPSCPECQTAQFSMPSHFIGNNKPLDESLICFACKYLAPTNCSLKAHVRTHSSAPPYVCPECGTSFQTFESLDTHMEDVCFHLIKQIRYRCPAQKCGKLFVVLNTFASHFTNHIRSIKQCSVCKAGFLTDVDFAEHATQHDSCAVVKTYNCSVCKTLPPLTENDYEEHVNWHVQDRERCVYIYTCKYCRSYFRSTATYAVHRLRCNKSERVQPQHAHSNCHFCCQKLFFKEKDAYKICIICKQINYHPLNVAARNILPADEKRSSVCILCKEEVAEEDKKMHASLCKYNNPVVPIPLQDVSAGETNDSENYTNDDTSCSDKHSTSNSDIETKGFVLEENGTKRGARFDDGVKKKRKRFGSHGSRNKKINLNSSEETLDLQAEEPVTFDGTYYCKLCDYKNTNRLQFHDHIVDHRDVSTAYQCMECGECFMVKPSLIKHLLHYHKISDTNGYLMKNDCYDKFAIKELESLSKLAPGEHRGPVKENQCTICLKECESALALSTHFRIHGMAFLMKKSK